MNPGRPGHRGFEEWVSKHPDIVFVRICQSNSTKHMIGIDAAGIDRRNRCRCIGRAHEYRLK